MGWRICRFKFVHGNGLCEFSESVHKVRTCHALTRPTPIVMLKVCPRRYDKPPQGEPNER